jgi:hypothetical protein
MKASLVHEIKLFDNPQYRVDNGSNALIRLYREYLEASRKHTYDLERRLIKSEVIPDYNHKHLIGLIGRAGSGRTAYAMWMAANVFNMMADDRILWVGEESVDLLNERAAAFKLSAEVIGLNSTNNFSEDIRSINPSMVVINANCVHNREGISTWMKRAVFMNELRRMLNENDRYNKIRAVLVIDQARGYNTNLVHDTGDLSIIAQSNVVYGINHETGQLETLRNRGSSEKTVYKEVPNYIYDVIHGDVKKETA